METKLLKKYLIKSMTVEVKVCGRIRRMRKKIVKITEKILIEWKKSSKKITKSVVVRRLPNKNNNELQDKSCYSKDNRNHLQPEKSLFLHVTGRR